jgi:hypothetical protein
MTIRLADIGRRRFTVTRCGGNSNPEFLIALRTRSRLSRTVASGRPTI